jgi:hypothetical protein
MRNGKPDYWPYIATVQAALHDLLCERPETQPGRYHLGLQLWLGPQGALTSFSLLGSTGEQRRDQAIIGALANFSVGSPPPPDLPEPLNLLIVTAPVPASTDCPNYPSLP